jgi:ribonuclease R
VHAQAAIDGQPDDATGPIMEAILYPLWNAYHAMLKGRLKRSPLQIESAERRIRMAPDGGIASIEKRASLEAHRLIEEMMIQANVCAAETLEQKKTPLIYRGHDAPSQEKIFNLADFLSTIGKPWNKGEPGTTKRFNKLLDETRDTEHADVVNEVVLRSQMQAIYSPENIGHFGLNLDRYAHFTSPIRRYSDLIVHRALIAGHGWGEDGLSAQDIEMLEDTAKLISDAERRSMAAERDTTDRYLAAYLSDRIGAAFSGRISGVQRFGLFVKLDETGADGLIPIRAVGREFFHYDEATQTLMGADTGLTIGIGQRVVVKLAEAVPVRRSCAPLPGSRRARRTMGRSPWWRMCSPRSRPRAWPTSASRHKDLLRCCRWWAALGGWCGPWRRLTHSVCSRCPMPNTSRLSSRTSVGEPVVSFGWAPAALIR